MPRLLSRRSFLFTGAALGGTALVAAVGGAGLLASVDLNGPDGFVDGERAVFNAFVTIHNDGRVTVQSPRTEMGQGIHTGLAMLVAEELDIPFDERITVEHAVENLPVYSNYTGPLQMRPEDPPNPVQWVAQRVIGLIGLNNTSGSNSTMGLWVPMRVAGASARHMLVAAAAERLGVPAEELSTAEGTVRHEASGRIVPYGELASAAALLTPPDNPELKPASAWRVIGRRQQRVDIPAKVRGEPVFGIDVVLPDMLHASLRQAPVPGAHVARVVNEADIRAREGIRDVAIINEESVGIVADSWWQAESAARSLEVEWTATQADGVDSAQLSDALQSALDAEDPHQHLAEGDVEGALTDGGERIVEAEYSVPFVTHACMESMNATVLIREDGSAEGWVPSQSPTTISWGVERGAGWAGINVSSVAPHITMNGGAFGRRSDMDVICQAAFLAARHRGRPVKLLWPREQDISRGMFRSHASGRMRASLGTDGLPAAYDALVAAQSLMQSFSSRNMPIGNGASPHGDRFSAEGLDKAYYSFPNRRVRSVHVPSHMPLMFWRSNGYSFGTFFAESFVDECALAAGVDPLEYRRALLRESPRHLAVLDRVAALSGWGEAMEPGRGRGIAIEEAHQSVVAQVAEVTVADDGEITVDRIFCAVDAGTVVNPDAVAAQMEGSIIYGLSAALMNTITVERGAVVQSNFHDFPMLRIANAPEIVVEIMPSDLPPGGAGEPGVIPVAPAVANAIYAATGRRLRTLPLAVVETTGAGRTRTMLRQEPAQAI
ncbi:molybdopterin cofactor-binding domain-containing protein [Pelagibacterium sp. H642]|uniref:xanthine dehydrogenase family protein molybdopterin-binding subunit n=1 Tax=Pelagibacterium sp. H642 TaxID=1881069 RepID=UPI0028151495|nr:molybdopterin cofactor-binding domain-containing protein [Pelagibacterium sp. H642]WMT90885.1 molybdopterin-dependent oxidoreductase [Pelagibacterium sp. H642]